MKKLIFSLLFVFISLAAFSQTQSNDSIWIARYETKNGVTKCLGFEAVRGSYLEVKDASLKVIGRVDSNGRLIITIPKELIQKGKYIVYSSSGQIMYMIRID